MICIDWVLEEADLMSFWCVSCIEKIYIFATCIYKYDSLLKKHPCLFVLFPPPSLHFSCLPLERNILARHWKLVPLSRFVLGLSSRYHSCPPYDRSVVSSNIFNKQFKSWWKLHVNVFMITEHCLRISHWSIWPSVWLSIKLKHAVCFIICVRLWLHN